MFLQMHLATCKQVHKPSPVPLTQQSLRQQASSLLLLLQGQGTGWLGFVIRCVCLLNVLAQEINVCSALCVCDSLGDCVQARTVR